MIYGKLHKICQTLQKLGRAGNYAHADFYQLQTDQRGTHTHTHTPVIIFIGIFLVELKKPRNK